MIFLHQTIMIHPLTVICFLLFSLFFYAQEDGTPSLLQLGPTAPDAAALWKFEDTPVNLSSGTTDISIPLITVAAKDFSFPITIAYNSSGIKVNEIATQVGLGWVLHAGGMLSKTIIGTNDETILYDVPNGFDPEEDVFDDHNLIINGSGQPDIYQYNLPHKSGRFIFNYNNSPKAATIPFDPILIAHERNSNYYAITDTDGIIYEFEMPTGNIYEGCESEQIDAFNTWHLTKITTPENNIIEFSYRSVQYTYDVAIHETHYRMNPLYNPVQSPIGTEQDLSIPNDSWCVQTAQVHDYLLSEITYAKGTVKFKYSDELPIDGQPERLDLPGALALRSIIQEDNHSNTVQQLDFSYAYFGSGSDPNELRLKLLGIEEVRDNNTNKKYDFIYDENTNLPNRLSHAKDHWGFYNGNVSNATAVPETAFGNAVFDGANRNPSANHTQAHILKKIIYPTRGYSEFEYEQNQYVKPAGLEEIMQSVQVDDEHDDYNPAEDDISELDGYFNLTNAKSRITSGIYHNVIIHVNNECYEYDEYGNQMEGDGELLFRIFDLNDQLIEDITGTKTYYLNLPEGEYYVKAERPFPSDCFGAAHVTWYEDIPIPPQNEDMGGVRIKSIENVAQNGISEIKEYAYHLPGTTLSSGKTSFLPRYISEYVKFYFYATSVNPDTGSELGNFPYFTYFGISSNSRIASEGVHYEYVTESISGIGSIEYQFYPSTNNISLGGNFAASNSGDMVSFEDGGTSLHLVSAQMTTEDYFQNKGLLKYKRYVDETGTMLQKNEYTYTIDNYPIDLGMGTQSATIANGLVSTLEEFSPEGNFQVFTGDFILLYYQPYQVKSGWNKLTQEQQTQYFENNTITITKDYTYATDSFQLQQVTTTASDGGQQNVKYYYPNDRYLLSDLDNNDLNAYTKLYDQYRIDTPIQTDIMKNNLITHRTRTVYEEFHTDLVLPKKVVTTKNGDVLNTLEDRLIYHDYDDHGNVLEASKENGTHISYIWGYNDQYPIAKIENATYAAIEPYVANLKTKSDNDNDRTLGYTGNEGALRQDLDALRNALPHVMITTYTYDPLIGITSITDSRGYTAYYHYDDFNRLELIKDAEGHLVSENKYHYKE